VRCRSEEAGSVGDIWALAMVLDGVAEWDEEWVEAIPPRSAVSILGFLAAGGHTVMDLLLPHRQKLIYITPDTARPRHIPGGRDYQKAFSQEVINMPYGYGYGRGFGFRGSSPPWPYVGRGRGGLPRCYYPGAAWGTPNFGGAYFPGSTPYPAPMSREQETGFLREEANAIKARLEEIETLIKELDSEQK
jgi:hypothetical protein